MAAIRPGVEPEPVERGGVGIPPRWLEPGRRRWPRAARRPAARGGRRPAEGLVPGGRRRPGHQRQAARAAAAQLGQSGPGIRTAPRQRTVVPAPDQAAGHAGVRDTGSGRYLAQDDQVVAVDDLGGHVVGQLGGPAPGPRRRPPTTDGGPGPWRRRRRRGRRSRPRRRRRTPLGPTPPRPGAATAPLDQRPAGPVVDHDGARGPDGEGDPQLAGRQPALAGPEPGPHPRARPRSPRRARRAGRRRR